MTQDRIAHECRTTVLTVADGAVRRPECLPSWVETKTGSTDFDLLTVPDFRTLTSSDMNVIASDVAAAVALHNGERLLPYVDADTEMLLGRIGSFLEKRDGESIGIDPPYDITRHYERAASETLVIGCMDFRLHRRDAMIRALGKTLGEDASDFDLFATAGGGKEIRRGHPRKDLVMAQLMNAKYDRIFVLSHEDCGKYGGRGAFVNANHEHAALSGDLHETLSIISSALPDVAVESGIVRLEGDAVGRVTLF